MGLKLTNEEIEAIKYYMESKFENINQLLISDSRTDIAFLSDEKNEGIEFSYAKDNIIRYLEVIKNIYRAIMKSYLGKGKKDRWSFARRTNTSEIEKFKNEPYIDSFLFVSLDKSGVSDESSIGNNSVIAYICGDSNIPFMKLEDALNSNNKYIIVAPFTRVLNVSESSDIEINGNKISTYTVNLEKQELETMTELDKEDLYTHIIGNSDLVNQTLHDAVFLEKENISNYESIRELEKQITDFEALIAKKEIQKDYSESERNADEADLAELNEKLDVFKNRSAEIFNSIKNNNKFMTSWKKNITVYLMAEFSDIEKQVAAELEADNEFQKAKEEILLEKAKLKRIDLEKESFEKIVEQLKKEAIENIKAIEKLKEDIARLISKQQNYAKIAGNMNASYSALNNAFEMKKKAEALENLIRTIKLKIDVIAAEHDVIVGSEKLIKISEINNQISILLNYLNNPKTIVAKSKLTRFDEMIVVEENELKRNIAKAILDIRGNAELKKLKDDIEIIEDKSPIKKFLGMFTGQNRLDDFILEQIDIRQNTIKKALSKSLRLDNNYSIHELVAEIRMFINENEDDELVQDDIADLEALEKEISKSFVIIESKVDDIIHEKENKNLPVSSKLSKKELIEIETYRFLNKYGYDRSDEYAKEEAVYRDTTANEITRIIEYINTSKVIEI